MCLMVISTLVIFVILTSLVGAVGGVLGAVVFFGGWFWFNIYSATVGIIKSNVNAYLHARKRGEQHVEALAFMVNTRYKGSPDKYTSAIERVEIIAEEYKSNSLKSIHEEDDIFEIILAMQTLESGQIPPDERIEKLRSKFRLIYSRKAAEFGVA